MPSRWRYAEELRTSLGASAVCFWRADEQLAARPVLASPADCIERPFLVAQRIDGVRLLREPQDIAAFLPLAVRARGSMPARALLVMQRPLHAGDGAIGVFVAWADDSQLPRDIERHYGLIELVLDLLVRQPDATPLAAVADRQTQGLANSLPQGVALVSPDDALGFLNPAAAALLQLAPGEIGVAALAQALQAMLERASNSAHIRRQLQPLLEPGSEARPSAEIWHFPGGAPRALRVTLAPLRAAAPRRWVWLFDDVSVEVGLQQQLQAEEQKFRDFFQHLDEAIALYALDGRMLECNQRFIDLFGARSRSWHDEPCPAAALGAGTPSWAAIVSDCLRSDTLGPYEGCLRGAAGSPCWVEGSAMLRRDASGEPVGIWEVMRDISARKATEAQLLLAAEAFALHSDGVMLADAQQRILTVNDAFVETTGYTREELRGQRPSMLRSGHHDAAFYESLRHQLREQGWWEGGLWNRAKDGSLFHKWVSVQTVRDAQGQLTHYTATYRDPARMRRAQGRVEYLATHDELTGLPNRMLFLDHLQGALQRAGGERRVGVLAMALRDLRSLASIAGSRAAQELVRHAAQRIVACCEPEVFVARSGETHFALHVELTSLDHLQRLGERLQQAFGEVLSVGSVRAVLAGAVGTSVYPDDAGDAEALLQQAEAALQHARRPGAPPVQRFRADMVESVRERFALEQGLRQAIASEQLFLVYQPQLRPQGDALHGCEALVRWRRADGTLVPPSAFVPVAEDCGLIAELTQWVLRCACRQLRAWDAQGVDPGVLGVNLSAIHFRHGDMVESLLRIVREHELAPQRLCLEVTEGAMAAPDLCQAKVDELKRAGFSVSVDDFGTGFSSLAYLKRFPLDELKVDRTFVQGIESDEGDRAIVSAIISMAHSLGLRVVAEGVENQAQLEFLRGKGCDFIQGYLFARPMPAEQFGDWVRTMGSKRFL